VRAGHAELGDDQRQALVVFVQVIEVAGVGVYLTVGGAVV
jgi:hypothetical protein